jgi:hypothetical protein
MKRIAAIIITSVVLLTGSAIVLKPHVAHAFTLVSSLIYFDPVSVTVGQTVHVHVVNRLGTTPFGIFITVNPTTSGAGSPVSGAAVTLAPGDGLDQSFTFFAFSPPPGATRIPVVANVQVVAIPPSTSVPFDFSGRLATSVEIIDDATGRPTTEIATTHHVVNTTTPCVFCN